MPRCKYYIMTQAYIAKMAFKCCYVYNFIVGYIVGPTNTSQKNVKICHRKCRPFEQHSFKEVEIK